jgi:hypothetical protein
MDPDPDKQHWQVLSIILKMPIFGRSLATFRALTMIFRTEKNGWQIPVEIRLEELSTFFSLADWCEGLRSPSLSSSLQASNAAAAIASFFLP